MKAVIYARVSTQQQADGGVSLAAQVEKARAMAVVQGAEVVDVIVDAGESAKNLDRPGMQRLLALVESRKIQSVIVAKLDRLTRSVRDLAELVEVFNKRGVSLVSVAESLDTGSAAGRLVLNLLTAVSSWEREAIGERTRDALQHKRNHGQRTGTIRFGYRLSPDGVQLEMDPAEQAIAQAMRSYRKSGLTLRGVADRLNADGMSTRRGTAWGPEAVHSTLKSVAC